MLLAFELWAQGGQNGIQTFAPFLIIAVLFYFILIRPQRREQAQRQAMLDALKKNDRVVTVGGIVGVVTSIRPDVSEVTIRTHDDTRLDVRRSHVAQVITETSTAATETTSS